tara:strand:+ start:453 stop:860 length:408 start_codon:yes stop_codon:yes gene_type:complete
MALTYTWNYINREIAEYGGIIRTVFWECTGTDDDGKQATIRGSTVFDVAAVILQEPEGLTGTRPTFVEEPTDAQCIQWIIDVHNAEESRLSALEAMLKKELYGDADDAASPPPVRDSVSGQQLNKEFGQPNEYGE